MTLKIMDARREGLGVWLKARREEVGLTQKNLADALGYGYYNYISAIENGKGRVPPEHYEAYAKLLKVTPLDFVKRILRYENPPAFKIIFGGK